MTTIGYGDFTTIVINGKPTIGIIAEAVSDRIADIVIGRTGSNPNTGAVAGIFRYLIVAAVAIAITGLAR